MNKNETFIVSPIENTWQKQREKNDKICYYLKVTQ
ncbi:MAG: hypothetical protein PWP53_1315 [Lacrimispora sp.]|nr:hypothetical protein [Lacrimispora sp.]